jgi:hypothetical protein
MGCRCKERGRAISAGASALSRGDLRAAAASAGYVGRTLIEDARSGALGRAATQRLAQLRAMRLGKR